MNSGACYNTLGCLKVSIIPILQQSLT